MFEFSNSGSVMYSASRLVLYASRTLASSRLAGFAEPTQSISDMRSARPPHSYITCSDANTVNFAALLAKQPENSKSSRYSSEAEQGILFAPAGL